jgi:DNA recombination protein RmuC
MNAPIWLLVGVAIGGGLLGSGIVWLVMRGKLLNCTLTAKATYEPQLAALGERIANHESQAAELRRQLNDRESHVAALQSEVSALKTEAAALNTRLEKEREAAEEKQRLLEEMRAKLSDAFKAVSSEALQNNNQSFLDLATQVLNRFHQAAKDDLESKRVQITREISPVKECLEKFDRNVQELEKARIGAYEGLKAQVEGLVLQQGQLRMETANLVKALRTPQVRGRWGEIQLKRVVEMAGMLDHCDFYEQTSVTTEEGRLRPDLLVRLPGGKNIVVDAKAPLAAYLDAIEMVDEQIKKTKLQDHARRIREHVSALSKKSYWNQFQPTPEFVILFLPGETFFSAALEQDPSLIEDGVNQGVILATPTTLIALLKAVAYGWRQERLAANAKLISDLGRELHRRIGDMSTHFADLGARLGKAVESYNRSVTAMESKVLVTARKFESLQSESDNEVVECLQIETQPRNLQSPELAVSLLSNDENGEVSASSG